jgi:hypothetical protein
MTTELAPLFEPIAARFDEQSQTIARLRAEVDQLRSTPPQPSAPPPPPPPDSTGWTLIPPPDTAAGARVVYASSSAGKNTNTGLSPDAPVETLAKAITLLRDNAGDRLLLRRGDTFAESFGGWTKSGRSPDQPLLISAYGDGPRPRVASAATAFSVLTGELHDIALVGLHLTAARRDPASPDFDPAAPAGHGVRIIRPVTNLLIEDCRLDFFTTNLTLTADDAPGGKVTNVTVRRCQVLDAYSTGGAFSGQGLYANHCDGVLIEENVFDHNGWNELVPGAAANIYRHNLYLSAANSAVTVRGNVIANGASHGLQLRAGGIVEDNLFLSNAVHCLLAGAAGVFRRNVVLGGRDIDAANPRGLGLVLACSDARSEHNLFAQKPMTSGNAFTVERNDWTPAGPMRAALVANTVYAWSGNGLEVSADCDLLEFAANDLQRLVPGRKVVTLKGKVARFGFAANRYDTAEPRPDRWFNLAGAYVPLDRWSAATGDTSRTQRLDYPDPDRTVPETFLAAARAQSRPAWDDDLTATAACHALRSGFEA